MGENFAPLGSAAAAISAAAATTTTTATRGDDPDSTSLRALLTTLDAASALLRHLLAERSRPISSSRALPAHPIASADDAAAADAAAADGLSVQAPAVSPSNDKHDLSSGANSGASPSCGPKPGTQNFSAVPASAVSRVSVLGAQNPLAVSARAPTQQASVQAPAAPLSNEKHDPASSPDSSASASRGLEPGAQNPPAAFAILARSGPPLQEFAVPSTGQT
jgi:hypothetical protein